MGAICDGFMRQEKKIIMSIDLYKITYIILYIIIYNIIYVINIINNIIESTTPMTQLFTLRVANAYAPIHLCPH